MTAEQILATRFSSEIFPTGCDLRRVYTHLMKQWHPDICRHPKASVVFAKVNELYKTARHLTSPTQVISRHELGWRHIYDDKIIYAIEKNRYGENAVRMTRFKYKSNRMKELMQPILPALQFRPGEIEVAKPREAYQLRSVLDYFDGSMPHTAVTWVISRLINLVCYFEVYKFVHNGIEIDSCFVDYKMHRIYLLGGWFYARPEREKLIGVPQSVYDVMPVQLKSLRVAGIETDIESVKQIGRLLLGKQFDAAPTAVKEWLNMGACDMAVTEFDRWGQAIIKAYGKRKWTPLDIEEHKLIELERRCL